MASGCASCKKSPPQVTLKCCSKCSVTQYCSRDCQKADWKAHRKICGRQAPGAAPSPQSSASANLSPPKGLEGGIAKPFTRLENGTWLHDRPEKDVYGLLIDAYRLRMDDMYNMEGEIDADSLYGGAPNGSVGFGKFLGRVASRPGLLPAWWNETKKRECEQLGVTAGQWFDLGASVEKSDIMEHYGESTFPMQLRMFAEAVYGTAPGGTSGGAMRQMMMMMEQGGAAGGMQASHLCMANMFGRR